jgi:HlyD family secretion protein
MEIYAHRRSVFGPAERSRNPLAGCGRQQGSHVPLCSSGLLIISALILFVAIPAIGCNGARTGQAAFETAHVTRGDIERRVIATGRIEPFSTVEIRSKVDGLVKTLTVDEGDRVEKGQVLIELDKDILISRVNEARAALKKAKAGLEQAQIEASTVEVEAAQRKYDRLQKLFTQQLAPKEQLEDAQTALTIAEQNFHARKAAVSMAQAELAAVTAMLERAENELSYATIISPMDGIVLSRDVDVGSAVASVVSTMGTLLMTLGDMREVHMVGDVDESDIGMVRVGMPARISVESYPEKKFHGVVRTISPRGIEKEKIMNFEVEITIVETDIPLRTNMTADAEIIVETHRDVLLVPQSAIRYERNQAFVEIPATGETDGRKAVDSDIGISGTDFSEVLSGLKEGDEVIVAG